MKRPTEADYNLTASACNVYCS